MNRGDMHAFNHASCIGSINQIFFVNMKEIKKGQNYNNNNKKNTLIIRIRKILNKMKNESQ